MTIQLFINYNPVAGATINTYRNNGNWHDNDLAGFLSDAARENEASCSVCLNEAEYALLDGDYLATINAPCQDQLQAVAEDLHFAISCWLEAEELKQQA